MAPRRSSRLADRCGDAPTAADTRLLTIRETAKRLGVSEDTIRRRISTGEVTVVLAFRVPVRELLRALLRHKTSANAGPAPKTEAEKAESSSSSSSPASPGRTPRRCE